MLLKGVEGVPKLEGRCECLRGERTDASGESEVSESLMYTEMAQMISKGISQGSKSALIKLS